MNDGTVAGCGVDYDAPNLELEGQGRKIFLRLKSIPWTRVLIDTLLVATILLASASFLSVK